MFRMIHDNLKSIIMDPRNNQSDASGFDDDEREEEIPGLDGSDRDETLKEDLGMVTNVDDLVYDEERNTYETDVKSEDPDYIHPDPYETASDNGADFNSDFDEANPTIGEEYDKDASLENDLDSLGMHVDSGKITELLPIDEELAKTPEDERDDLDEEGYPVNDRK